MYRSAYVVLAKRSGQVLDVCARHRVLLRACEAPVAAETGRTVHASRTLLLAAEAGEVRNREGVEDEKARGVAGMAGRVDAWSR